MIYRKNLWIVILNICIVLLLSLFSAIQYLNQFKFVWNPAHIGKDETIIWEERLKELRQDLPKDGVIGFISERDVPGMDSSPIDQDAEYTLTQYSLAPLILTRGTNYDLVIGNFGPYDLDFDVQKEIGVSLITNYGYGIYLLQGKSK